MKMILCWASVTYFQFHSRQFARRLAEEIQLLIIRGDACYISAVMSDYNMHAI